MWLLPRFLELAGYTSAVACYSGHHLWFQPSDMCYSLGTSRVFYRWKRYHLNCLKTGQKKMNCVTVSTAASNASFSSLYPWPSSRLLSFHWAMSRLPLNLSFFTITQCWHLAPHIFALLAYMEHFLSLFCWCCWHFWLTFQFHALSIASVSIALDQTSHLFCIILIVVLSQLISPVFLENLRIFCFCSQQMSRFWEYQQAVQPLPPPTSYLPVFNQL